VAGVEPHTDHRPWSAQVAMAMGHGPLSAKLLAYHKREVEPPSVTWSRRREPNHKNHKSSVLAYTSLDTHISFLVSVFGSGYIWIYQINLQYMFTCVFVSFFILFKMFLY
jgi:hypothetical protein